MSKRDRIIKILEAHQLEDSTEDGMVIHPLISHTEFDRVADAIIKELLDET